MLLRCHDLGWIIRTGWVREGIVSSTWEAARTTSRKTKNAENRSLFAVVQSVRREKKSPVPSQRFQARMLLVSWGG